MPNSREVLEQEQARNIAPLAVTKIWIVFPDAAETSFSSRWSPPHSARPQTLRHFFHLWIA